MFQYRNYYIALVTVVIGTAVAITRLDTSSPWWDLMPDFDPSTECPFHAGWTHPTDGAIAAEPLTFPARPTVGAVSVCTTTAGCNACLAVAGSWCEIDNDTTVGDLTINASHVLLTGQLNSVASSITLIMSTTRDHIEIDGGLYSTNPAERLTVTPGGVSAGGSSRVEDVIVRRVNVAATATNCFQVLNARRYAILESRCRSGPQGFISAGGGGATTNYHDLFLAYNSFLTDGDGGGNATVLRVGVAITGNKENYRRLVIFRNSLKTENGAYENLRVNSSTNVCASRNSLRTRGPRFSIQASPADQVGYVWFQNNTMDNIDSTNYGWSQGDGPDFLYYINNTHYGTLTQSNVNSAYTLDTGDGRDVATGNVYNVARAEPAWPVPTDSPPGGGDPNSL